MDSRQWTVRRAKGGTVEGGWLRLPRAAALQAAQRFRGWQILSYRLKYFLPIHLLKIRARLGGVAPQPPRFRKSEFQNPAFQN